MKKTIKLIALAGLTQLIAWSQLGAQADLLPEGFPQEDLVYNGDNNFTSVTFGAFKLDTLTKNRVIHTLLGPLVWDYDNENKVVTLKSEWWGDLHSTLPTETSILGFTWPYVLSELTGSIYIVDVSGSTDRPFFNHTRAQDPEATPPFWGKSIGIPLENAESYYLHAESTIVKMQQTIHVIRVLRDQLAGMTVAIGSDNIEQQRLLAIAEFEKMHQHYGAFQFYRQRANLAHKFVDESDENYESKTRRAQWFGTQVENLAAMADELIADAQKALFDEIDGANGVFGKKLAERTALIVADQQRRAEEEAARRAAEEAANRPKPTPNPTPRPNPTPTPTPPPPSGGGGSVTPTNPVNVQEDAISWSNVTFAPGHRIPATMSQVASWPVSAQLKGMRISKEGEDYYGHWDVSGAARWSNIISAGPSSVSKGVNGNSWIFVPDPRNPGKWLASPYEGFIGSRAGGKHTLGNLNIPHSNWTTNNNHREKILKGSLLDYSRTDIWGTPRGTPKSGVTYGWMVSTNAGLYSGVGSYGKARSNIILVTWP